MISGGYLGFYICVHMLVVDIRIVYTCVIIVFLFLFLFLFLSFIQNLVRMPCFEFLRQNISCKLY